MTRLFSLSLIVLTQLLIQTQIAAAEEVFLEPSAFISESFDGAPPDPAILMITGERRKVASQILGHSPTTIRVRYWKKNNRSAWILEEIGKVLPITTGITIHNGVLDAVKILIYRESHGSEVKHKFFTKQFENATLNEQNELSQDVDGISGATMSVSAIKRLARLALYFDKEVTLSTQSTQ